MWEAVAELTAGEILSFIAGVLFCPVAFVIYFWVHRIAILEEALEVQRKQNVRKVENAESAAREEAAQMRAALWQQLAEAEEENRVLRKAATERGDLTAASPRERNALGCSPADVTERAQEARHIRTDSYGAETTEALKRALAEERERAEALAARNAALAGAGAKLQERCAVLEDRCRSLQHRCAAMDDRERRLCYLEQHNRSLAARCAFFETRCAQLDDRNLQLEERSARHGEWGTRVFCELRDSERELGATKKINESLCVTVRRLSRDEARLQQLCRSLEAQLAASQRLAKQESTRSGEPLVKPHDQKPLVKPQVKPQQEPQMVPEQVPQEAQVKPKQTQGGTRVAAADASPHVTAKGVSATHRSAHSTVTRLPKSAKALGMLPRSGSCSGGRVLPPYSEQRKVAELACALTRKAMQALLESGSVEASEAPLIVTDFVLSHAVVKHLSRLPRRFPFELAPLSARGGTLLIPGAGEVYADLLGRYLALVPVEGAALAPDINADGVDGIFETICPCTGCVEHEAYTHYATLGVKRTASEKEIVRAFLALARTAHPDKATGNTSGMQKLTGAVAVLRNSAMRKAYDHMLQYYCDHEHRKAMTKMDSVSVLLPVGERAGVAFKFPDDDDHPTLRAIEPGSAADKADFGKFVGRRVAYVGAKRTTKWTKETVRQQLAGKRIVILHFFHA
eukprot:TRINITY_DN5607_c0_g1_i1.p1 TRINITY_DN5607_c0_g1~~TRINITY_DN5607_c0_g1_i1.p1  ORF type:complete len:699 (+),score=225.56 TRINITY_DN5607_c0_g1_i1:41-2098(+)